MREKLRRALPLDAVSAEGEVLEKVYSVAKVHMIFMPLVLLVCETRWIARDSRKYFSDLL
jgi:hypothetical protein